MNEETVEVDDVTGNELALVHGTEEKSSHPLDAMASLAKRFRHDRSLGNAVSERLQSLRDDLRTADVTENEDVRESLDVELSDDVDFDQGDSE